jgi:hypothetical protein
MWEWLRKWYQHETMTRPPREATAREKEQWERELEDRIAQLEAEASTLNRRYGQPGKRSR